MNKLIIPNLYYKDIYSINYKKLKDNNINYLLFDIDNTIGDDKERIPCAKAIDLIEELKNDFTIVILSNTHPFRAKRYGNMLGIPYYYFSIKPLKMNYKRIIKRFNADVNSMAAIGDQLYTDIKGANKMGMTSILVDKISNNETFVTKLLRIKEKHNIEKYKFIERGKYDD